MSETKARTICIVFFTLLTSKGAHSYCTNTYGTEICSFVPAPPGKTPPCASPGSTYCENVEHYPGERIQYLLHKWRFDHSTILLDETRDDFTSYYYPPPSYKYGPSNTIKQGDYYPEAIYIPKPSYQYDPNTRIGNTYIPPKPSSPYNLTQSFAGYPDRRPTQGQYVNYKYSNNIPPYIPHHQGDDYGPVHGLYSTLSLPQVNPYSNKIWNRKDGDKYEKTLLIRKKRSDRILRNFRKLNSLSGYSNSTNFLERQKRQSALNGRSLCSSRSAFVSPKAAMNVNGNWMFVVNMPETGVSQLVKSETCFPSTQTCDGICSLPLGATSRCEQRYVQKKLVALQGDGDRLYNDQFWIASCCVCTISNG